MAKSDQENGRDKQEDDNKNKQTKKQENQKPEDSNNNLETESILKNIGITPGVIPITPILDTNGPHVHAWIDGACVNNGQFNANSAIGVWFGPDHDWNVSAPVEEKQSNNRSELWAAIVAIEIAKFNGKKQITSH